jgi:hypothetical protein
MSNARLAERLRRIASVPALDNAPVLRGSSRDHRSAERRKAYKFAFLTVGKMAPINCIVLDISATGARLSLEGAENLPLRARLEIRSMGFDKIVEVRWRRGNEAGVRF